LPKITAYSESNSIGFHHSENQDSLLVDEVNLVVSVADGVGGCSGAKEASSYAIDYLRKNSAKLRDVSSLAQMIMEMHSSIQEKAARLGFLNMGTTIAVAKVLSGQLVLVGNVGDSPILLFRKNKMILAYEDDSQRSKDPMSMYGIIQYLGLECDLKVHAETIKCDRGDAMLLCSDGVTDNLLNSHGGKAKLSALAKSGDARGIVKSAIEQGIKPDDMTAVLISF
jgi:serine/threonine protein phosphatase PrpC